MLTNTASTSAEDSSRTITATTIAVDEAERRRRAADREIDRLVDTGQISTAEAADLEAETRDRFILHVRALELDGGRIVDPIVWARYESHAAERRADARADRRRSPRLRGVSVRTRALRERQMCVVANARVSSDVLRLLGLDDDDETVAMRGELAAAGLL